VAVGYASGLMDVARATSLNPDALPTATRHTYNQP